MKQREKECPFSLILRPAVYILLAFLLLPAGIGCAENDGREYFSQGRKDLEGSKFKEAVGNLQLARTEFPLLEDYTLYYLSEAYHGLGDHQKSLDMIRSLLEKFPASPLRKRARLAEIREGRDSGSDVQSLLEAYTAEYHDDEETLFLYGRLLREKGDTAKASSVFKKIYLNAGGLSRSALAELSPGDIHTKDVLERTSNLFRRYKFKDAEEDLRQALLRNNGEAHTELLRALGYSLFSQKKYREAAEFYGRAGDLYYQARSLYRAGEKKDFETIFESLLGSKDSHAGNLLLAVAADKRRERDFGGALKLYNEALAHYPSEAEDAQWGIGWTQYLAGDFAGASVTFSKLYEKYDDLKYLYWQARSMESDGRDASALYHRLMLADNNFYTAMAHAVNRKMPDKPASLVPSRVDIPGGRLIKSERIDALISLDMQKEAIQELSLASGKANAPSELLYFISKYQELGEYRRSISLAARLPYSEKMHRFWYPLAFWDTLEPAALRHNIDPMVALAVMREESRFDANARSAAGAYGLMQLMPQTAYRLDRSLKLGVNRPSQLTIAGNNIQLGSYYLKSLFEEFHSLPQVLAAYNAGEQAVRTWRDQGNYRSVDEFIEDIPYAETRNYVKKVLTSYFQYKKLSAVDTGTATLDIISGGL